MKKRYFLIMVISLLAFANALYLSEQAYTLLVADHTGVVSFCDLSAEVSCSAVLQSPYSKVFGVPFPFVAFFVYPILFILAFIGYKRESVQPARVVMLLSGAGMLFNFFIVYREIFFIKAFCILCAVCTVIIVAIFFMSRAIIKLSSHRV